MPLMGFSVVGGYFAQKTAFIDHAFIMWLNEVGNFFLAFHSHRITKKNVHKLASNKAANLAVICTVCFCNM